MNKFLWIVMWMSIFGGYWISFDMGYMQHQEDICYMNGIIFDKINN